MFKFEILNMNRQEQEQKSLIFLLDQIIEMKL
jgi:hypothetical protein